MRKLYLGFLAAAWAFAALGCDESTTPSPGAAPVVAAPSTYQQEALPPRPQTAAERRAYLQRFSADMAQLEQRHEAARRQQEQWEREAAVRAEADPQSSAPPVIPGWNGTTPPPPVASTPTSAEPSYAPPPEASYGGGYAPTYSTPKPAASGFGASGYTNSATGGTVTGPVYHSGAGTAYTYPNRRPRPNGYSEPDPNRIVYVTRTGEKYHSGGCRYLRRSQIPMRWREAVQGYSACSVCGGG